MQLKSMKGKIFKRSSMKHYNFSLVKAHKIENKLLTEIYIGTCSYLFSLWSQTEYVEHFNNVINMQLWSHVQCKISVDMIFLAKYWNLKRWRGILKEISCDFQTTEWTSFDPDMFINMNEFRKTAALISWDRVYKYM